MPRYRYFCAECGYMTELERPPTLRDALVTCQCSRGARNVTSVLEDVVVEDSDIGLHFAGLGADLEGVAFVDTPVGIELSRGATINVRRTDFGNPRRRKPKKKRE